MRATAGAYDPGMRSTRVSGMAIAAFFVVSVVTPGHLRRVLLLASFVAAATCVACLVIEVRRGYPARGLLILAALSTVLYIGGGIYVLHWSPEGDIGGGLPFALGLLGVLSLSMILSVASPHRPRVRRGWTLR